MKQIVCERCGGNNFVEQDGYRICNYCHTSFVIQPEDTPQKSSNIALNDDIQMLLKKSFVIQPEDTPQNSSIIALHDDVERLLQKCNDDPANASRYASLIFDIDPTNTEAIKFAHQKTRRR